MANKQEVCRAHGPSASSHAPRESVSPPLSFWESMAALKVFGRVSQMGLNRKQEEQWGYHGGTKKPGCGA
jgi:hypothetical protein